MAVGHPGPQGLGHPMTWAELVHTMAAKCWPQGYDISETAPDTLADLYAERRARGRITVWGLPSVFANDKVSHAFRAWHDWCHLGAGADFSERGEARTFRYQKLMMMRDYPDHPDLMVWQAYIVAEEMRGRA